MRLQTFILMVQMLESSNLARFNLQKLSKCRSPSHTVSSVMQQTEGMQQQVRDTEA